MSYLINFSNVLLHMNTNYKPKKVQSQLINIAVYDREIFNHDRAVRYGNFTYRLKNFK